MRILLTGASGMVGKNLLEHPKFKAQEVLAPSREELDLFSFSETEKYLSKNKPDLVVHAAGRVGGIQANIKNPVEFLVENIDINRNLIGACQKLRIKKLLNFGSSCMYPRSAENPLKEEMILKGELEPTNEGYALAKIFAQKFCQYINQEDSSFHYKTLIPCNLYGKYDKFDPIHSHLVPAMIHKIHQAKVQGINEVEIWGDGNARREFMHASDLSEVVVKAIVNFESLPDLMNVGLGQDFSINDYYRTAAEVIGFSGAFRHDLTKPVGMKQKLVSSERAKSWGWTHRYSLKQGLEETYQYYLGLKL